MISYDFDYYQPTSVSEATTLYQELYFQGKKPKYFSGGTEFLTLGRLNLIYTDAVIDIKKIPECTAWGFHQHEFITGAARTLSMIEDHPLFPLLAQTASGVADYTSRNKITIGGNICGDIFYREAVLPFLLSDSQVILAGSDGTRKLPIRYAFDQQLALEKGEFLVQLTTEKKYVHAPFLSVKKRQQWETGYPLVTVAALEIDGFLRFAFSGVCPFPFRSDAMEKSLNDSSKSYEERALTSLHHLPYRVLSDIEGSKDYRLFVLKNTLVDFLKHFKGGVSNR